MLAEPPKPGSAPEPEPEPEPRDGSLDRLLEAHLPGLRAFVRLNAGRTLRAREAQSDLVQSVCREVLEDAGGFEYRGEAAFKLWLYQAARRKIIDRARYWRRDKRAAAKEVPLDRASRSSAGGGASGLGRNLIAAYATFCTPSQDAILNEEQARIEAAFAKLSLEHRKVITLARVVGLSHAEIAKELSKSEVAVRQLLHRALAALSRHLETKA